MNKKYFFHVVTSISFAAFIQMMFLPLEAAAQSCPELPRAYDQVFVCLGPEGLSLSPEASIHNPVRFTFPPIASDQILSVNFGDGGGYHNIHDGDPLVYEITYPSEGQYTILWRVIHVTQFCCDPDGEPYYIHTVLSEGQTVFQFSANPLVDYNDFLPHEVWSDMSGNTFTPPQNSGYPVGSPWNDPVNAGGIVSILYANPDHKLRKPFILIDGFDPVLHGPQAFEVTNPDGSVQGYGIVRWDVLMTGREESFDVDPSEPGVPHSPRFYTFPSLVQGVLSRGYDIVFVDLADGGTYIQANGEFLIKVIERINNEKVGDFPNVLIGASMGGFIGRYALSKMESEGKNHCTGLFGTFDTPNNGANIPLGLQAFAWFAHVTNLSDEAWKAMDSPGARQMLISRLGSELQANNISIENVDCGVVTHLALDELQNVDYDALRTQILNDLNGLGWPQRPRKIALLDGMKNGTLNNGQGFGPGGRYFYGNVYADKHNFGTVANFALRSTSGGIESFRLNGVYECPVYNNINKWWSDCNTGDNTLFSAAMPKKSPICELPLEYYNVKLHDISSGGLAHLDNAPGSYRMDVRGIDELIKKDLPAEVTFTTYRLPKLTFVPTWSGLAMTTPLNNTNLYVDLTTPEFAEENLPNAKAPNYDNFYAPSISLRHVELDAGMKAFILAELDRLNAGPLSGDLSTEYNYGKLYKDIPNTTIKSTGKLNVNNTGATGFVNNNPLAPATKPSFTTYLRDCGQLIEVESGGQFNIGALNKSQHGITEVWEGSTVHVKSGGTLHITSESSKLLIKHGAELILDQGAIVWLESPGSKILLEGDLVLNGDIVFKGLGYFDFNTGNKLVFGNGYNSFKLGGAGKDKRFVRISDSTYLDNNHRLNWENGLVEFATTMYFRSGAGLDFNAVTLHGDGANTALDFDHSGNVFINNSNIEYLNWAINGVGLYGINITGCAFEHYNNTQVYWRNALSTNVINSTFDGNGALNALWFENVSTPRIQGSDFQGHAENLGVINDISLYGTQFAAVKLINATTCLVNGSHFRSNTIGIKAEDETQPSNVYVYNGCSFLDHDAAIYLNGNATKGTVLADCSIFTNNRNGIRGRDVTLVIDSWNSANWTWDTDSPNKFVRSIPSSENYIRLCYQQKPVAASNLMRNNFWSNGVLPDPNPADAIFLLDPNCVPFNPPVTPSLFPLGSRRPGCWNSFQREGGAEEDVENADCTEKLGNTGSTIQELVSKGLFLMRENNFEPAVEAFRPVASLYQKDLNAYSEHCQQGIQLAKAMVDSYDANSMSEQKGTQQIVETSGNLKLVPNPANAFVTLYLTKGINHVKVVDVQGRLKVLGDATDKMELDTHDWEPGVYLVETLNTSGVLGTGKLVIQR